MVTSAPEIGRGVQLVVVGGSAGGIQALTSIVRKLPPDFAATMLVVIHVPADHRSRLPEILGRQSRVPVAPARDNEPLLPGTIRIAPPDHHLVVHGGRLRLTRDARVNRHRPAIDALFTTAASYGDAVVGVIISGGPGDGLAGAQAITGAGGQLFVQEPRDAAVPALPESVIHLASAENVIPADELGARLANETYER